MSLTSYRAAPPRVICVSGPRLSPGWRSTRGSRGSPKSLASYEPDEVTLLLHPALLVGPGVWWVRGPGFAPRVCASGLGGGGGLAGPGGDLLFHALRRSTIGAEGFHGRVRDGIGCFAPRYGHQAVQALRSRDQGPPGPRCLGEVSCVRVFC